MRRPLALALLPALLTAAAVGIGPGAGYADPVRPPVAVSPAYGGARVEAAAADVGTYAATRLAPGLTLSDFSTTGPNKGAILTADLTEPTLKPKYLNPGTVGATATLTTQANRAGAVAAVNGDFFDIGATGAPRGVGIDGGGLLHGPASGWNNAAALYAAGAGTRGGLASVFLDATVTLPGGAVLTASNLNSPNIAANGIGIYNPLWGDEPRSQVLDGATRSREIEISGGAVSKVSTSPGGKVAAGTVVVLGVGTGADALAGLRVGDVATVDYRPRGGDGAQVAIGGNLVLVRDGMVTTTSHPRNPRTAVGFSADGLRMWLVVVDGRSGTSVGMTYVELANFMKSLGADDALNLDGGGSSTLVARMPGATGVSVRNTPSDGAQRPVPNGIGFVSTAQPAACVSANLNLTGYPALSAGATGPAVTAAQCLLMDAGFGTGAAGPTGTFDTGTAAATTRFQQDRGLTATGTVDARTWTALLAAGDTPILRNGSTGYPVTRLQRALTAALGRSVGIDGAFGPVTERAVRDYQTARGLGVDGVVGTQTWGALQAGR
ncbi:phosphodiester glycosidase family protein [Phytohabitans sp. ZYX-F-186]|uniref:Phosphodiester glycosidase family protein n=1 Tax=Phytohabitans maris TaxID=3071409 RepID=A0ABU0ZMK0_9ACTN|nr:phosphodiester glycosidase family protein [Phytohabitans sp. ZYX-F-186]MDQ7908265.1 phosphodiester glycosidase family protein [Phytohabitans sp. ZYX-F-186]